MRDVLLVLSGYRFMSAVMKFSWPVRSWVLLLVAFNMSSLFFLDHIEARVVLGVFLLGGMFLVIGEYRLGLVRLLGLGHSLWLIMLPWLYFRLDQLPDGGLVRYWIMGLLVINGVSLVIDIIDVIRYIRGDRAPQV